MPMRKVSSGLRKMGKAGLHRRVASYSAVRNPGNPIHAGSHSASGAGVSDVRSPLLEMPNSGFYSSGRHYAIPSTGMWPRYNIGPPSAHQRM